MRMCELFGKEAFSDDKKWYQDTKWLGNIVIVRAKSRVVRGRTLWSK